MTYCCAEHNSQLSFILMSQCNVTYLVSVTFKKEDGWWFLLKVTVACGSLIYYCRKKQWILSLYFYGSRQLMVSLKFDSSNLIVFYSFLGKQYVTVRILLCLQYSVIKVNLKGSVAWEPLVKISTTSANKKLLPELFNESAEILKASLVILCCWSAGRKNFKILTPFNGSSLDIF